MFSKTMCKEIVALIKKAWYIWIIVGLVGPILNSFDPRFVIDYLYSDFSLWWIGIIGGLLPFVIFHDLMKSINVSKIRIVFFILIGTLVTYGIEILLNIIYTLVFFIFFYMPQ